MFQKNIRAILTHPKAKGKEDIKCTLRLTTEMGECGGWESCTTGGPQKWANDKVEGLCRLYQQLTTEMGECGGWESSTTG